MRSPSQIELLSESLFLLEYPAFRNQFSRVQCRPLAMRSPWFLGSVEASTTDRKSQRVVFAGATGGEASANVTTTAASVRARVSTQQHKGVPLVMPVIPHDFPSLRLKGQANHRKSVLLIGAGVSYGLVPSPGQLLKDKRTAAEATLDFAATVPVRPDPFADDLYDWADQVFQELNQRNDPNPKLKLANLLDIPHEDYWMAYVSSNRDRPRHRVIARFAREKLWKQIWSLNWDCIQENAFENVGLKRDGEDACMPWPTVFRCFITAAQAGEMGEEDSVKIIKPHGCAFALKNAEEAEANGDHETAVDLAQRFLITSSELAALAPDQTNGTQTFVFANLCTNLGSLPFIVVGWRASEGYLLDYIGTHVVPALKQRQLADDELCIIDLNFNADGHTRLATFYAKAEVNAHIKIEPPVWDLDTFFLWLQAAYALSSLERWVSEVDRETFAELLASIKQPPDDPSFVYSWADNFLPVWVRLCWRCGLVNCLNREGQPILTDDINLESRDEHIPWIVDYINRPELRAAVTLLLALYRSPNASNWDFDIFPGGLYRNNELVIPVPAWTTPPNDLRGLKALIDALRNPVAYIRKVKVLFLVHSANEPIPEIRKNVLKELIAKHLTLVRFASGSDIVEIGLEEL